MSIHVCLDQVTLLAKGCRDGAVVRALASHQCVLGSIPRLGIMCGLSLLVLYSAPRGFSPDTPVFPSCKKKTTFQDLICVNYKLRNGPDKNDSNNGNEHVGIQLVCKKVITFLLSVLTSDWLKQQTVNKTS